MKHVPPDSMSPIAAITFHHTRSSSCHGPREAYMIKLRAWRLADLNERRFYTDINAAEHSCKQQRYTTKQKLSAHAVSRCSTSRITLLDTEAGVCGAVCAGCTSSPNRNIPHSCASPPGVATRLGTPIRLLSPQRYTAAKRCTQGSVQAQNAEYSRPGANSEVRSPSNAPGVLTAEVCAYSLAPCSWRHLRRKTP